MYLKVTNIHTSEQFNTEMYIAIDKPTHFFPEVKK